MTHLAVYAGRDDFGRTKTATYPVRDGVTPPRTHLSPSGCTMELVAFVVVSDAPAVRETEAAL